PFLLHSISLLPPSLLPRSAALCSLSSPPRPQPPPPSPSPIASPSFLSSPPQIAPRCTPPSLLLPLPPLPLSRSCRTPLSRCPLLSALPSLLPSLSRPSARSAASMSPAPAADGSGSSRVPSPPPISRTAYPDARTLQAPSPLPAQATP